MDAPQLSSRGGRRSLLSGSGTPILEPNDPKERTHLYAVERWAFASGANRSLLPAGTPLLRGMRLP